jgi:hypothetical protein
MNNETKQTAVEWLIEQWPVLKSDLPSWLIEQAKEMEKEQIIDAYHINPMQTKWENIGFNYYNETYGGNK